MPRPAAAKDWCFTLNNPKPHHEKKIRRLDYSYLVFQVEIGAEGTPHIQGFIQFQEKKRLSAIKKLVSKRVHWEKRRGTPQEASHYCKKPVDDCDCKHCNGLERFDVFFEDGIMSQQGERTELQVVADTIVEHGLANAIQRFPVMYIKFNRGTFFFCA